MKLLLTSDLHSRWHWFDWIAEAEVDAILIGGDLLDGFSPEGLLPQMVAVSQWAAGLRCPLAVCSGNHDANFPGAIPPTELVGMDQRSRIMALSPRWMDTLDRSGVVGDGRSEVVEWGGQKAVVSTIPYSGFDDEHLTGSLWDAGDRLRREHRIPWFVLNHEPPAGTAVGGSMGDASLHWMIEEYQPDYVLSGHIHGQPYHPDGNFAERIGTTWCFNPGAPPFDIQQKAKTPNHIWLDTFAMTAVWHAEATAGQVPITRSVPLN